MVNTGQVVEDDTQTRLKLLSEFPGVREGDRTVVEDVAYEVKARYLAWDGRAVDEERRDNYVTDLKVKMRIKAAQFGLLDK